MSRYELTALTLDDTHAYYGGWGGLWRTLLDGTGKEEELLDSASVGEVKALEAVGGYVYVGHSAGLGRVPLTGGALESLVTDPPDFFEVTSIATDGANWYYTASGYEPTLTNYVGYVPFAGGARTNLVTGERGSAVAVTWLNVFYATGADGNPIRKVPVAGGTPTTATSGGGSVNAMVVNSGILYFTRPEGVYRANPGSGDTELLTSATAASKLSVSPGGWTIFFLDDTTLRRVPYDASDATSEELVEAGYSLGVASTSTHVYYISTDQAGLFRLAVDGIEVEDD